MSEMFFFCREFPEIETKKAVNLFYFIDNDIGGVVFEGPCSNFYLFYIAQTVVFGTHSYGEYRIEKVIEFFAAGKMVLGDWT